MDSKDEIITPEEKSKNSFGNNNEKKRTPNRAMAATLALAGIVVIVLVIVIIAALNNSKSTSNDNGEEVASEEESDNVEVEVTYTTPEGSENPEADYEKYLEEQKTKASTPEEEFEAELNIINNSIYNGEYVETLSRLDAISRDGLSTEQLFALYNVYTRLFEGNGDTARYDEYVALRDEQFKQLSGEE